MTGDAADRMAGIIQVRDNKDVEFSGQRSYVLSIAMRRVDLLEELCSRLWLSAFEEAVTQYPPDPRIIELGNQVGIAEINKWMKEKVHG